MHQAQCRVLALLLDSSQAHTEVLCRSHWFCLHLSHLPKEPSWLQPCGSHHCGMPDAWQSRAAAPKVSEGTEYSTERKSIHVPRAPKTRVCMMFSSLPLITPLSIPESKERSCTERNYGRAVNLVTTPQHDTEAGCRIFAIPMPKWHHHKYRS